LWRPPLGKAHNTGPGTFTRDLCKRVCSGNAFVAAAKVPGSTAWGRTMSFIGSVGSLIRRGILASPAFVVAPLLLLAAACGSGVENTSPQSSESAALSSSSKHSDAGTQYSFVLFDVPGATRTLAFTINDFGSAAGNYWDVDGGPHAFVRGPSGTITTFAPKGAVSTVVGGINDFGLIAGYFTDANGRQHGYLRKPNGNITQFNLPNPPAVDTNLAKLNNSGVLLGATTRATYSLPSLFWSVMGR
jgi:hypothetical protein